MQVRKVAVVATGALATAAVMGSTPAFAAEGGAGTPEVAPAAVGLLDYEGKHRASDEAMRQLAEQWLTVAPEQTSPTPWEQDPPQILSVAGGSAVSAASWQQCGTNGPWVAGATVPVASPATVVGDCNNGNVDIAGSGSNAMFSVLDNTAINALAWQQCGSNGVGAVGASVPISSPATVGGGCDNGNITIGEPEVDDPDDPDFPDFPDFPDPGDGYYPLPPLVEQEPYQAAEQLDSEAPEQVILDPAPWEQDPAKVLSVASGSAVSAASWQQCGTNAPWVGGIAAPIASPATVLDDCRNGNIDIHGGDGNGNDAMFSLLDRTAASVASWQQCGSNGVGGVGANAAIASPATTGGGCDNGNISVR